MMSLSGQSFASRNEALQFYGAAALLVAAFWLLISDGAFNGPVAIMVLAGVVLGAKRGELLWRETRWRTFVGIWLCFWIPMLVSLVDAIEIGRAVKTAAAYLRFPLLAAFVFLVLRRWPRLADWILVGVVGGASFMAVDMLWQYWNGYDLFGTPVWADGRATGPTANNKIGLVMGVLFPVMLETAYRHGRRWWPALLPLLLVIPAVVFSGQRGGWVALLVGGVVWAVVRLLPRGVSKLRRRLVIVALALALVLPFILVQLAPANSRLGQSARIFEGDVASINYALSGRLGYYRVSWHLFRENWINGIGPRGYRFALEQRPELLEMTRLAPYTEVIHGTHPHSSVLEIASETGVIGLLGYLLALGWLMVVLWRSRSKPAAAWLLAALVALSPLNISLAIYGTYYSHLIFYALLLGLAWPDAESELRPAPP